MKDENRHVIGGLLLFGMVLIATLGWYFLAPLVSKHQQSATSDASATRGRIVIGVDNFFGYYPLCSPRMRTRMLAEGYELVCRQENDLAARFAKLKTGELTFAVGTVDSYLLNGRQSGYPGVVVSVIDVSHGADAIVARKDAADNLDALRLKSGIIVAFAPNSPSHHLLKSVSVHFDIPWLRNRDGSWKLETDGSSDALKRLIAGNAQLAVLWEPDLSKALAQENIVKLIGTEMTEKLIVDVLLVGRDYVKGNEDVVTIVLRNYFKTLKEYREGSDAFEREVSEYENVRPVQARSMLAGVNWYSLQENATMWFGLSMPGSLPNFGLKEAIDNAIRILTDYGDLNDNPLPEGDWRRIVYSKIIGSLFADGMLSLESKNGVATQSKDFPSLNEERWKKLTVVGMLRIRHVLFQSGSSSLSMEDKQQIDESVLDMQSYPRFRILVEGHTKPGGSEEENVNLSNERAESVARYLEVAHSIDVNRIHSVGLGASKPLARENGESYRSYVERQSRVEVHLLQDAY